MTLRNFQVYDPIRKATSLVLDGKTLQNLEVALPYLIVKSDAHSIRSLPIRLMVPPLEPCFPSSTSASRPLESGC